MVVLEDPIRWRQLVHEYATLRQLRGDMTPQARGQRFNGLIAELFTVFGVAAQANQRSVGEIDVNFNIEGRRFILEAKWEKRKTGTGPIAKLQRRIEQRMSGVFGVFLSIGGYSEEAIFEMDRGRRLDTILLDRDHWEAMLSGFVTPAELLNLATDQASYHGRAYTPLRDLLEKPASTPYITFEPTTQFLRAVDRHIKSRTLIDGIRSRQVGIHSDGQDKILITTDSGVLSVDLSRKSADLTLSMDKLYGNPLTEGDSIVVQREYGVARYEKDLLKPISSGGQLPGKNQLLIRPDHSIWRLAPGILKEGTNTPTVLLKLGREVGDEQEHVLPTPLDDAVSADWLSNESIAVIDGSNTLIMSGTGDIQHSPALPKARAAALIALSDKLVIYLGVDSVLRVADPITGHHTTIGVIDDIEVLECRLAKSSENSIYLALQYRNNDGSSRIAIVHISIDKPWPSPQDRSFEADGQNISGTSGIADVAPLPEAPAANLPGEALIVGSAPPLAPRIAIQNISPGTPRTITQVRLTEHDLGRRDGSALAMSIPLFALEGAVSTSFDIIRWMQPWREHWRLIATGQAPPHSTLENWLPKIARNLGSYVAPQEIVESHFTPTPAYVAGFSYGVRTAWEAAIQHRAVPRDMEVLTRWLRESVVDSQSSSGTLRGSLTLKDLRRTAIQSRVTATWGWIGRIALWATTAFFAIGTLVAVILTLTNGWPTQSIANSIGGLLFYSLPFAGLLWATIADGRRLRRKKRERLMRSS